MRILGQVLVVADQLVGARLLLGGELVAGAVRDGAQRRVCVCVYAHVSVCMRIYM
jgi:hypothetical protein